VFYKKYALPDEKFSKKNAVATLALPIKNRGETPILCIYAYMQRLWALTIAESTWKR
jgi:hypothetical protein